MQRKTGNGGYALVWTMVVLLLLSLLTAVALQMGGAMSRRSLLKNQNSQAYFTARSVVDTIAAQLTGDLDDTADAAAVALLKKLRTDGSATMTSISGLPGEMGDCTAVLKMSGTKLTITATASVAGQSYTLTGVLNGTIVKPAAPPAIGPPGLGLGGLGGAGLSGSTTLGVSTDKDTSIFIWDENDTLTTGRGGEGQYTVCQGSIYTKGKVHLLDGYFDSSHVHGELVADKDIIVGQDFTVGPWKADCCDNDKPSFLYTPAALTLLQQAKVGCDITAYTVSMSEQAQVKGKLTADTLTVTTTTGSNIAIDGRGGAAIVANTVDLTGQGVTIVGDVVAGHLVMENNTVITGNVRADVLEMDAGSTITGTVVANEVIMRARSSVGSGMPANSLCMTADSLRMTDGAKVHGAAIVNTLTSADLSENRPFSGKLTYYDMSGFTKPVSQKEQMSAPMAMPVLEVMPVSQSGWVSKVPEPEPTPELVAPDDAPAIGGGSVTIDTDSGYKVGQISGSSVEITSLTVRGSNPAVIFVPDGSTLTLHKIHVPDKTKPNLFVVLGQDAVLRLGNPELVQWQIDRLSEEALTFPVFVLSQIGSQSRVDLILKANVYGGISVDGIRPLRSDYRFYDWSFHWVAPSDLDWINDLPGSGGGGSGGSGSGGSGEAGDSGGSSGVVPDEDDVVVWKLTEYARG